MIQRFVAVVMVLFLNAISPSQNDTRIEIPAFGDAAVTFRNAGVNYHPRLE
jgi:hypothetical protein